MGMAFRLQRSILLPADIVLLNAFLQFITMSAGQFYSVKDIPANMVVGNGVIKSYKWYKKGLLHRENGPALVYVLLDDVTLHWYLDGEYIGSKKLPAEPEQAWNTLRFEDLE
jgi:hypothetical protein